MAKEHEYKASKKVVRLFDKASYKKAWRPMKRIIITIFWCILAIFSYEAVRRYCEPEHDLLAISQVQRELTRRGFPCKIDGIYGPETAAAWKAWEKNMLNHANIYWFKKFALRK